jgi:hypothetical protein
LEGANANLNLDGATKWDDATQSYQAYQELHIDAGELVGTLNGQEIRGDKVRGTRLSALMISGYVLITGASPHHNIYTCTGSPLSLRSRRTRYLLGSIRWNGIPAHRRKAPRLSCSATVLRWPSLAAGRN